MLLTTMTAIHAILKTDPSLTPDNRSKILGALRDYNEKSNSIQSAEPVARLLRRAEVARRFGVSLRAIDSWVTSGILSNVKLPGRIRASGIREADVIALINNKA